MIALRLTTRQVVFPIMPVVHQEYTMTGIISPLEELEAITPRDPATEDVDAIRELVLKAHPDVIPELIQGDSIAALLASVEPAQHAYSRVAESLKSTAAIAPPMVPAGGSPPVTVDVDRLPAAEKIKRGLAASRRNSD